MAPPPPSARAAPAINIRIPDGAISTASNRAQSITKLVRQRLQRFFDGEWEELWDEANSESTVRPTMVRTAEQDHRFRVNRARHLVLAGQLHDGRQVLTGHSLLSLANPQVTSQFDEIFTPSE